MRRESRKGRRLAAPRASRPRFSTSFQAEELESRQLLSTMSTSVASTPADITVQPSYWYWNGWTWSWRGGGGGGGGSGGGGGGGTSTPLNTVPSGNSPSAISQAYGFNQISFNNGGTSVAGDGTGQTIAIVDAYNDPNIASDLATFDSQFHLAAPPKLTILNQNGSTALPSTSAAWAQEISLDVEWAHAMAPGATIDLVEANSSSLGDLLTAVSTAAHLPGVSVVSMSWGTSEFAGETAYDSTFNVPGVTFVASSGDTAGIQGAEWPAASPYVVSVGGTTLSTTSGGAYGSESAWSGVYSGSGGGVSSYEATPSYQSTLPVHLPARTTPDVAYNANPNTGFAVYDSLAYQGQAGWLQVGGTSAGAPQWAALAAIANQGRALNHLGAFGSPSQPTLLSALYGLGGTLYQSTPSTVFHDITSGYNAFNTAGQGFDAVTGLGSPIANALVASLVGQATSSTTTTTTTTTKTTTTTTTTTTPPSKHPGKTTQPHVIAPTTPVTTVLLGVSSGSVGSVLAPSIVSIAMPLPSTTSTAPTTTAPVANDGSSSLGRGQSLQSPRDPGSVRLYLGETRTGATATKRGPQRWRDRLGPYEPLIDELTPHEPDEAGAVHTAPPARQPAPPPDQAPAAGEALAPLSALEPIAVLPTSPLQGGVVGGLAIAFGVAWFGRFEKRDPNRRRSLFLNRQFEDLQARS